jgi:hypothetical protein
MPQAHEGDNSIDIQQMGENDGTFEPFCQNDNNKKVINVSFNDFNQSMTNEYGDGEIEVKNSVDGDENQILK